MAKGYLGPASQQFLSSELRALGVTANTVEPQHLVPLADAIREHAVRLMGAEKADALADAIAQCEGASTRREGHGHKLASDAAAKLFETGKLRQAEKAYLELVAKHADRESYIGLARVQAAIEDQPAALETLREGAAKMARAGDRGNAVSLLAEAVGLAPLDLSAHRRLAAALANQGDLNGAVDEYARFVDAATSMGDPRRAMLELAYGRETLGDLPRLIALVDRVQNPSFVRAEPSPEPMRVDGPVDLRLAALRAPTKSSEFRINVPPAPTSVRAASPASLTKQPAAPPFKPEPKYEPVKVESKPQPAKAEAKPQPAKRDVKAQPAARPAPKPTAAPIVVTPAPASFTDPRLEALELSMRAAVEPTPVQPATEQAAVEPAMSAAWEATPAPAPVEPMPIPVKDAPKTRPLASETAVFMKGARTFTHAEPMDLEAPVDMLLRAGVVKPSAPARPKLDIEPLLKQLTPTGSGIDAAAMAASRAALLTSARDNRATDAALDAAQRLLALGKLQTASDVLLDLIAHGFADREAQRLLIEVDCALGRRDVAKEKCTLLGHAYRLDGRREVAEDVERLARIL